MSVLVFASATEARQFVDAVSVPKARSCVVDAINEYLRTRDPEDDDPAGLAAVADLATRSDPVRFGDHARAFELSFRRN